MSFIFENNGSLISQYQRVQYECEQMKDKNLQSRTTTTSHDNRKGRIELTIFFKTRTLVHFPAKYYDSCTVHCNFWVGGVVFGADY